MPDERRKLLGLLLQIPSATERSVRHSLLAGLPDGLILSINFSNSVWADFNTIINVVDGGVWAQLPDGSWSIILLINNAVMYVSGSSLEQELRVLRDMLEARATARTRPDPIPLPEHRPGEVAPNENMGRDRLKNLTGKQQEELLNALLSAFENLKALEQMVRFGLDESLDNITGETHRKYATFDLIDWAIRHGRIEELVVVARKRVPRNPELQAFADTYLREA